MNVSAGTLLQAFQLPGNELAILWIHRTQHSAPARSVKYASFPIGLRQPNPLRLEPASPLERKVETVRTRRVLAARELQPATTRAVQTEELNEPLRLNSLIIRIRLGARRLFGHSELRLEKGDYLLVSRYNAALLSDFAKEHYTDGIQGPLHRNRPICLSTDLEPLVRRSGCPSTV